MTKRLVYLTALLGVVAVPLRGSPPIGAVVQGSHYDPEKQVVTFDLLNSSSKQITAVSLMVRVTHPDGTESIWNYGGDFLPFMIDSGGKGAPAPGATFSISVPLGQQEVQTTSATVDVVVYADYTADVLNDKVFQSIVSQRKGRALGLQKANQLLQNALADPNDAHPSVTVAGEIKELVKQYNSSGGFEAAGLLVAATNISNAPKSSGRSEKEDDYLRALIKRQQDHIALMLPHTQLSKGVQP